MWISKIKADSGDRSPYGEFWFEPVSIATLSGMRVSSDSAMRLSAVFRAVQLLSSHMAMFPVSFYEAGTRKRIARHPLLALLNKRPNRFQNAFEWRQMLQGHLELRGNAYCEISANGRGQITELTPRHPDRVKVEMLPNGDYRYVVTDPDGTKRNVPRGSMWHLRGLSSNGITGISVIECARESFGAGLAAQQYGSRFFANDAKPTGGWVEMPGMFKDKEARQIFRDTMQQMQTGMNRHKIMVLDQGMKYHEVGVTNKDAQFLESRKFSVSDIARWFGVPPHKLGDLDRATFSNIEQQSLEYIQDALQPRATMWESSIIAELLFDDEEIDIEFEFHELLRGDSAARALFYQSGINAGWLARNEARNMEGMEPLEGLDEPLRPLNMVEEGDAGAVQTPAKPAQPPIPKQKPVPLDDGNGDDDEESARRLRALLAANAERLARRFAKAGIADADADVIASAMAVSEESAKLFCTMMADVNDEKILAEMFMRLGKGTN